MGFPLGLPCGKSGLSSLYPHHWVYLKEPKPPLYCAKMARVADMGFEPVYAVYEAAMVPLQINPQAVIGT